MTPREMAHVLRLFSGGNIASPPGRSGLDALMTLFPDDKEKSNSTDAARPGDLLVFRWREHHAAKHLGICFGDDRFLHAYEGHAVMLSPLIPQWRRRIVGVFAFPEIG